MDDSDPAVTDELAEILPLIGKTPGDAIADYQYVQEAKRLTALVKECRVTEAEMEAAEKAFHAHIAETKRIEEERFKEFTRLRQHLGGLRGRAMIGPQRHFDLRQYRSARGDLFTNVPMVTLP